MITYLTANDAPSGVYKSQVVDVVKYLNSISDEPIRLVCLFSLRNFSTNKKLVKDWLPDAKVYPMFPRLKHWKKTQWILTWFADIKKSKIIARGPIACSLALKLSDNVVYDGRGAYKAELQEFPETIPDPQIVESLIEAERESVLNAQFRIAVSKKLVEYWRTQFGYEQDKHTVIPCTLSDNLLEESRTKSKDVLQDLGWSSNDLILIYSGSGSGWQSFESIAKIVEEAIVKQNAKVLFLSRESSEIDRLLVKFPDCVARRWLSHESVADYLAIGDYGLLIRDPLVTNQVASPVKFAEYLSAGLKVIISHGVGDYSEIVDKHKLGFVLFLTLAKEPVEYLNRMDLVKTSPMEKERMRLVAMQLFTKHSCEEDFLMILRELDGNLGED